jgi:hypothetical protein
MAWGRGNLSVPRQLTKIRFLQQYVLFELINGWQRGKGNASVRDPSRTRACLAGRKNGRCPSSSGKIIQHVRGKKWKAEWIDPKKRGRC